MNTPNQTRRTTRPPLAGPSLSPFPNSLRPSAFKVRPSYLASVSNYSPRDYINSPLIPYEPSQVGSPRSSSRSTRILPASATFSKPNPFEVLSAPAFDEFVDDVTSRIKKALAGPVKETNRLRVEGFEDEEENDVFGEVKRVEETEEVRSSVDELIVQPESEIEVQERVIEEEEEDEESSDDDNEVSIILQRELIQVKQPIISRSPSLEPSLSPLPSQNQDLFTQNDLNFYINTLRADSSQIPFSSATYEASPTPELESQILVKSYQQPLFAPESPSDDQSDQDQNYNAYDEDEDAEEDESAVDSEMSSYEDRLAGFETPNSIQPSPSQAFSPQVRYDTEDMEEEGENEYTGDEEDEYEEEGKEETVNLPKPLARAVKDEVEVIELGSSSEEDEESNEQDQEEDSDAEGEYDDEEEEEEEDQLEESTAAFVLPVLPPSNIRRAKITGPPSGINHSRLQQQQNISTSALLDDSDEQESGEEDGEESDSGSAEEGSNEEESYEEEIQATTESKDCNDDPRPSQDDRRSLPVQLEDEGETDEDGSGEEDDEADQEQFKKENINYPSQEYLEDSDAAEEEYEEQESESLGSRIPYHLKGKGPEVEEQVEEDEYEEEDEESEEEEESSSAEYNEYGMRSYSVEESPSPLNAEKLFQCSPERIGSIMDVFQRSLEKVEAVNNQQKIAFYRENIELAGRVLDSRTEVDYDVSSVTPPEVLSVEDENTSFEEYAASNFRKEEDDFEMVEDFSRDRTEDLDEMQGLAGINLELQQEMEREMNEFETKSIAQLVMQQQQQQFNEKLIASEAYTRPQVTHLFELSESENLEDEILVSEDLSASSAVVSPVQEPVEEVLLLDISPTEAVQDADTIVELPEQEVELLKVEQETNEEEGNVLQNSKDAEQFIVSDINPLIDIEVVEIASVELPTKTSLELEVITLPELILNEANKAVNEASHPLPTLELVMESLGNQVLEQELQRFESLDPVASSTSQEIEIVQPLTIPSSPTADQEITTTAQVIDEETTQEVAIKSEEPLELEAFDSTPANEVSESLLVDIGSEITTRTSKIDASQQVLVLDSSDEEEAEEAEEADNTQENAVEDVSAPGESSEPISYYGSEYELDESLLATNYTPDAIGSPPRVHNVFSAGEWDPTTPIRFGTAEVTVASEESLTSIELSEDMMMEDFEVSADFANNFFEDVTLESFEQQPFTTDASVASGSDEVQPTYTTGLERDLILPPGFLESLAPGVLDSTLASMPDNFFDESQSQPRAQSYSQAQTADLNSLTNILPIEVTDNLPSELASNSILSAQSELVNQFLNLPQALAPVAPSLNSDDSDEQPITTGGEPSEAVELNEQAIEVAIDEVEILPSSTSNPNATLEDPADVMISAVEEIRVEQAIDNIQNDTVSLELSNIHIPAYVEPEIDGSDSLEILVPVISEVEVDNSATLSPTPPFTIEDVIEEEVTLESGERAEVVSASLISESNFILDASTEFMEDDESQELIVETFTRELSPLPLSSATIKDVEEDLQEQQEEEEESQELIVQVLEVTSPKSSPDEQVTTIQDKEELSVSKENSPSPSDAPDPIIEDSTIESGYTSDVDDFEEPLIITPVKGRSVEMEYEEEAEITEDQDSADEITITLLDNNTEEDRVVPELEEDEPMALEATEASEIVEEAIESSEDELTLISTRGPRKPSLTSAIQSSTSLDSSSINRRNSNFKALSPPLTRSPRKASPAVIETSLGGRRKSTRLAPPLESNAPSTSSLRMSSPSNVSHLKRSRSSEISTNTEAILSTTPKRSRRNSVITRQSSAPLEDSPPSRRPVIPRAPRVRVHTHVNHTNLPRQASETPSDPGNDSPANLRKSTRNKSTVNHVPITRSHCEFIKISIQSKSFPSSNPYIFIVPSCAIVSPLAIDTIQEFGIENLGPPGIIEEVEGIRLSGTSNEGIEDHQIMAELIREDDVRVALRRIVGVDILNEGVVEMLPREEQVEEEVDQLAEEEVEQEAVPRDQVAVEEEDTNPLRRSTRASGPFSPGKKRKGDESVGGGKKNKQKKERFSLN